jgi:transposase
MRSGCPWRDLFEVFGRGNTVYKRFNARSAAGKLTTIFNALLDDPYVEWLFIDGIYTKSHQH